MNLSKPSLLLTATFSLYQANAIVLTTANTLEIDSVVIEGVTFNSVGAADITDATNARANLDSLIINNGDGSFSQIDTSTFTNTINTTVGAYTPTNLSANLGVFTGDGGGTRVGYNPNTDGTGNTAESDFLTDVQTSVQSPNLRNYFDFNSVGSGESVSLTFTYGSTLNPNGTILIGERDGNSAFTIEALNAAGSVVGNIIEIGSDSEAFAFDTGIGASADTNANGATDTQSIELAVFEVSLFNTAEAIQSLRFNNASGADIFVLAPAPATEPIPEPASFPLIIGAVAIACTLTRRQRK